MSSIFSVFFFFFFFFSPFVKFYLTAALPGPSTFHLGYSFKV